MCSLQLDREFVGKKGYFFHRFSQLPHPPTVRVCVSDRKDGSHVCRLPVLWMDYADIPGQTETHCGWCTWCSISQACFRTSQTSRRASACPLLTLSLIALGKFRGRVVTGIYPRNRLWSYTSMCGILFILGISWIAVASRDPPKSVNKCLDTDHVWESQFDIPNQKFIMYGSSPLTTSFTPDTSPESKGS